MNIKWSEVFKKSKTEYKDLFRELAHPLKYLFLPQTLFRDIKFTSWGQICYKILETQIDPLYRCPIMVLYFSIFIVFVGGFGAWVSLFDLFFLNGNNYLVFFQALSTFALSLIATSVGEMILVKNTTECNNESDSEEPNSPDGFDEKRQFRFLYFCIAIIAAIMCTIGIMNDKIKIPDTFSCWSSLLGAVSALFLWWQINAFDSKWGKSITYMVQQDQEELAPPNSELQI